MKKRFGGGVELMTRNNTNSNTNEKQLLLKVLDLLLRYHRHLGLSHEQYILLHTCIQYNDMPTIEDITGFSEKKIVTMLKELMDKQLIVYNSENGIEIEPLYEKLIVAERSALPIRDLLVREYQNKTDRSQYIGQVDLVPMKEGIAVRWKDGNYFTLEKTRELVEELNTYIKSAVKDEIQQTNRRLFSDPRRKERYPLNDRMKKVSRT